MRVPGRVRERCFRPDALFPVRGALQQNGIRAFCRVRAIYVCEQFDAVTQAAPYVRFHGTPGRPVTGCTKVDFLSLSDTRTGQRVLL